MMSKMKIILIKADTFEEIKSKIYSYTKNYIYYNEIINICYNFFISDNYDKIRKSVGNVYIEQFAKYIDLYNNIFLETATEAIPDRYITVEKCNEIKNKIINRNSFSINYTKYTENFNCIDDLKKAFNDYETLLHIDNSPILIKCYEEFDAETMNINDDEIKNYFKNIIKNELEESLCKSHNDLGRVIEKVTTGQKTNIVFETKDKVEKHFLMIRKSK